MKTASGTEIKASSTEREAEIVNIINTYETLEKATDAAVHAPDGEYSSEKFQSAYQAQWNYYAEHVDVLSKAINGEL